MERRKSIKTALSLVLVFGGIAFLFDVFLMFSAPLRELCYSLHGYRGFDGRDLQTVTKVLTLATTAFAVLPKCILALCNLNKPDFQKQRGLTIIILTEVFSVLSAVVSYFSLLFIGYLTSTEEMGMLSCLSTVRRFTGMFSSAATIILFCCGAIELYNGFSKPAYPPYNGIQAEKEDT